MYVPCFATSADVNHLAQMHVQAWEETYRGLMPDAAFAARDLDYRLALYDRLLQTSVKISLIPDVGFSQFGTQRAPAYVATYPNELYSFYVLRGHHGTGAAQALLTHGNPGTAFSVSVLDRNARAIRFYEKIGGTPIGKDHFTLSGENHADIIYGVPPTASFEL